MALVNGGAGVVAELGDIVAGKYRVEALIGQGGFGVVYRAVQIDIERLVALKMLLPHALATQDSRSRFRREAELARRLEHPNTVRLYDFGESAEGAPFIVWEYLKGRPLDSLLRESGALGVSRAARIASQTLKSLMEAHALGIVHRDIKPSNLFICEFSGESDFVKVLDFGIAKATGEETTLVTDGGAMLGTPAYMSPEQVSGGEVTPSSDLYSLGLVIAEIVSGAAVYRGDSGFAVAMAQMSADPPPLLPAVLDSPLGPVVVRATHKEPEQRFTSAREMLDALEASVPAVRGPSYRPSAASFVTGAMTAVRLEDVETAAAALPDTRGIEPLEGEAQAGPVSAAPWSARPTGGLSPAAYTGSHQAVDAPRAAEIAPPLQEAPPASTAPAPVAKPWTATDAPPERKRAVWPFVAGGLVVVLCLGTATVVAGLQYFSSTPHPREHDARGPTPVGLTTQPTARPPTSLRSGKVFGNVTAQHLREGIERAGYTVTSETVTEPMHQILWMIQHGKASGLYVMVWRFDDEHTAIITEKSYSTSPGFAVIRSDAAVLIAHDVPNGKKLLEQISR